MRPPHNHPHTLTHTLPVLYHTTPSPHLFITPFRSCKSSKVNFSLNLPRARRRRHCIVRRCSTRTYYIHTNGWWMNEKQISRGLCTTTIGYRYILNLYVYIYKTSCAYNVRVNHAFRRFVFGGIFSPVNNNNIIFYFRRAVRRTRLVFIVARRMAAKCNINY